jgi:hypothetical protein
MGRLERRSSGVMVVFMCTKKRLCCYKGGSMKIIDDAEQEKCGRGQWKNGGNERYLFKVNYEEQ